MNPAATARLDPNIAREAWTDNRASSDRAFRVARRHSRRVRRLRIFIPAVAVLIFAGVAAWAWVDPLSRLPVGFGPVSVTGSKITMQSPRLTGFSRDARPYELTAKSASQDISKPDIMELTEIHARIKLPQDASAEMTALEGVYDSKNEILKLGRNVVLTSSSGYKAWLSDAVIDIRKTHVVSEKPVKVEMLQGTLDAKRLEVTEAGAVLLFDGGVQMVLTQLGNNGPAAPANPAQGR